jgi:predicted Na+-dependent transporter
VFILPLYRWCSLFNADLALSVTMSALSTVLSIVMLPFNLYVFTWLAYGHEIVQQVNWVGLFGSILMVIVATATGLFASSYFNSPDFNLRANRVGTIAGAALIVFSLIMANSNPDYHLWDRDWSFYFGVAMPCLLGLVVATGVTTCLCLVPPERVTVAIEVCFQNVSIPIAIAISIYDEDKLAEAIGVPVFWGISEAVLISGYCIWAWQAGWTRAPVDIVLWEVLTTSYEANQSPPSSARQLQVPASTRHIQRPESARGIQLSDGDGWDYVEHCDADAKEPDSGTIDVKSATA